MKLKENEISFGLEYNITGFGKEENTKINGLVENSVIEIGSFLSNKVKIEILKINNDSVELKIIDFLFAGTNSKNGKLINKNDDNQELLTKINSIEKISLSKDYILTMKLNEEISIYSFVEPSPSITIKITDIYERQIRLYE